MFSKSEEAFKVLKELEARVSDELFDITALKSVLEHEELAELNYDPDDPLHAKIIQDLFEAHTDVSKLIAKLKRTV